MSIETWGPVTDQTVLSTQLNSLGNGSFSALGAEVDNVSALATDTDEFRYAVAQLDVTFGSAPTDRSVAVLYLVPAYDGTNYAYATQPSQQMQVGEFQFDDTTNQQRVVTAPFIVPPFKFKFVLENRSGQSFPASGSTVKLGTFNRVVN